MIETTGWATEDAHTPLAPRRFRRADVGPSDVRIDIAYCGVCHSDIHQARDEWPGGQFATNWPCLPGHEIAGTVAEVGHDVRRFSVGDRVAVGCMVNSCGHCVSCKEGLQQYCESGATFTYNTPDPDSGEVTFGGYSDSIVVTEGFVLSIPDAIALEQAGPIVCSGVTTYSPLRRHGVGAGSRVGIAGIGGLGSIAVKLAKALGAEVVALTRTPEKIERSLALGADRAVLMSDERAVEALGQSLTFILSTIPTTFDVNPYLGLLGRDGTMVSVGAIERLRTEPLDLSPMVAHRLAFGASLIGGIPETQEVLDFCAEHRIGPEIEIIAARQLNDAFDAVVDGRARFRYVLDASTVADRV